MADSELRQNPFDASFSFRTIVGEAQTIAEFNFLPGIHGFVLDDRPNPDVLTITFTEDVSGGAVFTIITSGSPSVGQVRFDSTRGICEFNIVDTGKDILINYEGAGSNLTIALLQRLVNSGTYLSKSVAGASDVNLTVDEALNFTIELTGLITADIDVTVPDDAGTWLIVNSTTGLFKITFKTLSGAGIDLEQNGTGYFYSDATNMRDFNPIRGRRNYIINGETEIAQELTANGSITDVSDNEFVGDNWRYNKAGLGLVDFDHDDSDLPPNEITAHALKFTVNTLDASVLAADKHIISAFVHAPSMDYHNAKLISTGIYVKANHTARYYVSLRNDGEDRSYVYPLDITAAEGWKEIKTPLLSDKTGTWLRTRGSIGMRISIVLRAGSDFHGTANQWNAANDLAGADIDNFLASGSNEIAFTQVRLQQGLNDGPFEMLEESDLLDKCTERYEKSYSLDVAPGSSPVFEGALTMRAGSGTIEFPLQYKEKIKVPVITLFNPNTGTVAEMFVHGPSLNVTGATANTIGTKGYFSSGTTNVSVGNRVCHHHVIDARFKT